jgi:hypothetical protein
MLGLGLRWLGLRRGWMMAEGEIKNWVDHDKRDSICSIWTGVAARLWLVTKALGKCLIVLVVMV